MRTTDRPLFPLHLADHNRPPVMDFDARHRSLHRFHNGSLDLARPRDPHRQEVAADLRISPRIQPFRFKGFDDGLRRDAYMKSGVIACGHRVQSIKKGFAAATKRAGLPDVTPHILRHTAASWMAMADVPMFQISKYLGHSDTRVTERRYAQLSPSYLKGTADALDW